MRRAKDFVTHHLGSTSFLIFSYLDYPYPESALNLFVSLSLASLICPLSLLISFTLIPHLLFIPSHLVYPYPEPALNLFVSRLLASRIRSSSFRISFTRIPHLLFILSHLVYSYLVSRISYLVSASKLYPVQKSSKMLE